MVERQLQMELKLNSSSSTLSPETQKEYTRVEKKGEDFVMAVSSIFETKKWWFETKGGEGRSE